MNKVNVSFIMFWFIRCIHQTHGNTTVSQLQYNSSNDEYDLEAKRNKILFNILKVDESFKYIHKINLIFEMLKSLKSISKYNCEKFDEMKNAVKDNEKHNTTLGELFNISQDIEEVIDVHFQKELNSIANNNTNVSIDMNEKIDFNDSYDYVDESYTSSEFNDEIPPKPVPPTIYYFMKNLNDFSFKDIMNRFSNNFQRDIHNMNDIFKTNKKFRLESNKWYPIETSAYKLGNDTRRVYRGSSTNIEKYSFLASIHVNGVFTCAGSIIRKNLVITAASCLQASRNKLIDPSNPNSLSVRVGSDYSKRFGIVLPIIDVVFHPEYDPEYLCNNLAIARTKGMKFNSKYSVKWVDYERTGRVWSPDTYVTMLGWGDKDTQAHIEFDPISGTRFKLYNLDACKETYSRNFVTNTNFCGGFVNSGNGACNRDLGGPGIIHGVLTGVISFGPPVCGTPDAPTVFTHLGHYADWIDSVVRQKPSIRSSILKVPSYASIPSPNKTQKTDTKVLNRAKSYPTTPAQYSEAFKFLSDLLQKLISADPVKVNDFYDFDQRKAQDRDIRNEIDLGKKALGTYLIDQVKHGFMSVLNKQFDKSVHNNEEGQVNVIQNEKDNIKVRNYNNYAPIQTSIAQGKYDNYETDVSFELSHLNKNNFGRQALKHIKINKHEKKYQAVPNFTKDMEDYKTTENYKGQYKHRYQLIKRELDINRNEDIKETFNEYIQTEFIPETTRKFEIGFASTTDINPSIRGATSTFATEYNPPATATKNDNSLNINQSTRGATATFATEYNNPPETATKNDNSLNINPSTRGVTATYATEYNPPETATKNLYTIQPYYEINQDSLQKEEIVPNEKPNYYKIVQDVQKDKGIQYLDVENTIGRSKTKTSDKIDRKQRYNYNYDLGPHFVRDDNPFRQVVISRNSRSFNNGPGTFSRRKIGNRTFKLVKKVKRGDDKINFF